MEILQAGAAATTRGAGKAQAVGQLAKQAVAEARAGGAELARNAQGKAASGLARGDGFAAVVTSLMPPPPVTVTPLPPAETSSPESEAPAGPEGQADAVSPEAAAGYGAALDAMVFDGAAVALDLLVGAPPEDQP